MSAGTAVFSSGGILAATNVASEIRLKKFEYLLERAGSFEPTC